MDLEKIAGWQQYHIDKLIAMFHEKNDQGKSRYELENVKEQIEGFRADLRHLIEKSVKQNSAARCMDIVDKE